MHVPEPKALAHAHDVLMDQLAYAKSLDSLTGEIARKLDKRLKAHMKRETETIIPLVSSFEGLAQGKVPSNAAELKRRYSEAEKAYELLFAEHREILSLVSRMQAAAREEKEEEIVRFCEDFVVHALLEEQVLYPAAVIAGRYLQLMGKGNGKGRAKGRAKGKGKAKSKGKARK